MKIIHRLASYIEFKGISLNSFDKSIGVANGYIGKQIKNEASIGADIIEKIISIYTDLNLEWLFSGKGEMIKKEGEKSYSPPEHYEKRIISVQEETINTLQKYNRHLEEENQNLKKQLEKEKPAESGQKRKAVG